MGKGEHRNGSSCGDDPYNGSMSQVFKGTFFLDRLENTGKLNSRNLIYRELTSFIVFALFSLLKFGLSDS
jgi:hypothetical protein